MKIIPGQEISRSINRPITTPKNQVNSSIKIQIRSLSPIGEEINQSTDEPVSQSTDQPSQSIINKSHTLSIKFRSRDKTCHPSSKRRPQSSDWWLLTYCTCHVDCTDDLHSMLVTVKWIGTDPVPLCIQVCNVNQALECQQRLFLTKCLMYAKYRWINIITMWHFMESNLSKIKWHRKWFDISCDNHCGLSECSLASDYSDGPTHEEHNTQ